MAGLEVAMKSNEDAYLILALWSDGRWGENSHFYEDCEGSRVLMGEPSLEQKDEGNRKTQTGCPFIAELSVIVNVWKEPKCPLPGDWINKQ